MVKCEVLLSSVQMWKTFTSTSPHVLVLKHKATDLPNHNDEDNNIYLGKWVYAETCENTCRQVALSCIDLVVVIQSVCCDTVVISWVEIYQFLSML